MGATTNVWIQTEIKQLGMRGRGVVLRGGQYQRATSNGRDARAVVCESTPVAKLGVKGTGEHCRRCRCCDCFFFHDFILTIGISELLVKSETTI
ncbi:hypothetical protein D3C86_1484710 [compost metagenome]